MAEPKWRPASLAEAKRGRQIEMTGPSGTNYLLQTMTLDDLAAAGGSNGGGLPDDLVRVALLDSIDNYIPTLASVLDDPKKVKEAKALSDAAVALRDRLVQAAVVQPKLTARDVAALDPFDKDMIAKIAQRKILFDAAGRRVGSDALATFRAFAAELGCDPDSEAFARALGKLARVQ